MMNMTNISESISSLISNPWFLLTGFILGLLSFIGMIYFYYRGKKEKLPSYYFRFLNIIKDLDIKIDSLKMFYSDKQIVNLSINKIIFWNDGRETIYSQDIPISDPLILCVEKDFEILNYKLIHTKNPASQFKLVPTDDVSIITHLLQIPAN